MFPHLRFIYFTLIYLSLTFPHGVCALARCRSLTGLRGINPIVIQDSKEIYYGSDEYFCAATAPAQYHCRCGVSSVCLEKLDPWGNNMGVCGCCPPWLIAFFVFFALLLVLAVIIVSYVWGCRGRWWWDGYPRPVQPVMARRGPAVTAPATAPLPSNLFRGYRIAEFVSEPVTGEGARQPLLTSETHTHTESQAPQQQQQEEEEEEEEERRQSRLSERSNLPSFSMRRLERVGETVRSNTAEAGASLAPTSRRRVR